MPEGPEIKRAAMKLAGAIEGSEALLVEFAFPHLREAAKRLTGKKIRRVEARGKAMLIHFGNGETIYSHNQLYGAWSILERGELARIGLQIRLAIHNRHKVAVLYSASAIEVLPSHLVREHPYIAKLGVEILGETTTPADVLLQVSAPRWARKSLAGILLDQSFLAGLGNYLRSEILFVANIHPSARLCELTEQQHLAIANASFALTHQSYRTGGITNDIKLARKLQKAGEPFNRYRHWVFDRDHAPCHRCSTSIERLNVSGRGLYWCPSCQAAKNSS